MPGLQVSNIGSRHIHSAEALAQDDKSEHHHDGDDEGGNQDGDQAGERRRVLIFGTLVPLACKHERIFSRGAYRTRDQWVTVEHHGVYVSKITTMYSKVLGSPGWLKRREEEKRSLNEKERGCHDLRCLRNGAKQSLLAFFVFYFILFFIVISDRPCYNATKGLL